MAENLSHAFLCEGSTILRKRIAAGKQILASEREFRSMFGCSPVVCAVVWVKCQFMAPTQHKHLLWVLMFLRLYSIETSLATHAGVTAKTYRKKVWPIVKSIAALRPTVVSSMVVHCFSRACYSLTNRSCFRTGFDATRVKPVK